MPTVSGTAAIESWDEKPYLEIEDGKKLSQASIRHRYEGDLDGESTSETLMCYTAEAAASYAGYEHFVGRIGDREGSFVVRSVGTYDGSEARSDGEVVPGSGTGDFVGLQGRYTSVSTHDDYPNQPYTFEYELG